MSQSFKELLVWKTSKEFTIHIYSEFSSCRDFGFRDQILRATLSIMNNIAEGQGRRSDKSFKQFMLIAKGSAAEVESMLEISSDLGYLSKRTQIVLLDEVNEIQRLLSGFIKKLSAISS